ncbi:hypothetical protein [Romboutsia timonensis]|uniref:hypothetical protein n=1 Tax=Romboutsia timonensis TaxID=1776391 RepID=UPI002A7F05A5|nr:hypothetical protein [Romboutsia timonensis]MDY3959732.1 hypothetical protein [Romboutsia timonensis]
MNEKEVFSEIGIEKILYGKFKDIYIPLVNKDIICKSLNFYNPNYIKGKIYKKVISLCVRLFNSKFFIKEYNYFYIDENLEEELNKIDNYKYCAVCAREDNINKDYIIQLMDENGKVLGYGKYPRYDDKKDFVDKEVYNLNYINTLDLECVEVPKLLLFNKDKKFYIQSTKDNLINDSGKLSTKHIDFLSELYRKTKEKYKFEDSRAYNQLINISEKTNDKELIDLSNRVLSKLDLEEIEYCYSHGDFYPPNIKIYKDFLYVYDWEDGKLNTLYHDIFHYIINTDITDKIKNKEFAIENILNNNKWIKAFEVRNKINNKFRTQMFILYLYEIIYDFAINGEIDKKSDSALKNYIETLNNILERN